MSDSQKYLVKKLQTESGAEYEVSIPVDDEDAEEEGALYEMRPLSPPPNGERTVYFTKDPKEKRISGFAKSEFEGDVVYIEITGSSVAEVIPDATKICLSKNPSYKAYSYVANIYGGGPSGAGSRTFYFKDGAGEMYSLNLYIHKPSWHYVQYNSGHPEIIAVDWDR